MPFENVKIIDPYVEKGWITEPKLTLADDDDVNFAETIIEVSFPDGYKEYVTTLGLGEYCNFIRIKMPQDILFSYKKYQTFLNEYWFWEMGEHILSKEKAIECVKIGDTDHGDVVIFHPSNSSELFVLPHEDDMLYRVGDNLYEAIDWLCVYRHSSHSGSVGENHEKRYFVPYDTFGYTKQFLRSTDMKETN